MQFIRLPHQIFQYRLPAGALVAYLALAKYTRKTSSGSSSLTMIRMDFGSLIAIFSPRCRGALPRSLPIFFPAA